MKRDEKKKLSKDAFIDEMGLRVTRKGKNPIECEVVHIFGEDGKEKKQIARREK